MLLIKEWMKPLELLENGLWMMRNREEKKGRRLRVVAEKVLNGKWSSGVGVEDRAGKRITWGPCQRGGPSSHIAEQRTVPVGLVVVSVGKMDTANLKESTGRRHGGDCAGL